MATPQESTTTVSGRRCTFSRARTAATLSSISSSSTQEIASSTSTTSTTPEAQPVQSSAPAEAPASPPPPTSSVAPETTQQAPPEASSSTIGTSSAVSSTVVPSPVIVDTTPQAPAAAVPAPAPDVIETLVPETTVAPSVSTPSLPPAASATSTATISDSILVAISSSSAISLPPTSSLSPSSVLSATALPEATAPSEIPQDPSPIGQPQQPQPSETGLPTEGSAGVIGPDQGTAGGNNGLTLPLGGTTNVASVVGGVVGGFVGLAAISALLFLCLRRRRTGGKWERSTNEKGESQGGFRLKMPDKLKKIPERVGMFIARIKGNKSGPASNPYRRHTAHSSVSSVYSIPSNRRSQSISEPPSRFLQFRGLGGRMPSLKKSRSLLQKKQDSLVVGSKSPFPMIVEDPVARNSGGIENPFADPIDPPRNLQLLNPDPESPRPPHGTLNGLQDQQRGPIAPKPTATSERGSVDPFTSILNELDERNGSGTPEWLRETAQRHRRTASSQAALGSHPPSNYTASVYTNGDNPFFDPSDAPAIPNQPLPPNPPSRPANTYTPFPQFNTTSSTVSRVSKDSFYFGEPGPSRPTTNAFGGRVRQSDPFDLDRPEVLGFGDVGGRMVRASVTRQNSRKRNSSVPKWVNVDEGPYERASAVPGPLRKASNKRKP